MADYTKAQSDTNQEWPKSVEIGKGEETLTSVDIELPDKDFIVIAREAHHRNITLNKLINIILKDSLDSLEYRFEHESKPQLLSEDN